MKEFLIPEYNDTKWVPEGGYLWLELDKKYDTLFIPQFRKHFKVLGRVSDFVA